MISGTMFGRIFGIFALLSPFLFPWQYVATCAFIASIWYPPVAFAVGLEFDALYFVHGVAWMPLASVLGFIAMLLLFLFRRLAHTYLFVP